MADSYNAQNMEIVLTGLQQSIAALQIDSSGTQVMLRNIQASLQGISFMLAKEYEQVDVNTNFNLTGNEYRIDRQGRRFVLLFTPTAVAGVLVNVLGITGYTITIAAGWTILNLPDGSTIKGPTAATNQAMIIKATNWCQSGAV